MPYDAKKGEIFNCEIKSIGPKGNGVYEIHFRIININELVDMIFITNIKSNWTIPELLNYYKRQNYKFQVEFDGLEPNNPRPLWILRKVNKHH